MSVKPMTPEETAAVKAKHPDDLTGGPAVTAVTAVEVAKTPAPSDTVSLVAEVLRLQSALEWLNRRLSAEQDFADALLEQRDAALAERDALHAAARSALAKIADVANECAPCDMGDGTRLVPTDAMLAAWGAACTQACALLRDAVVCIDCGDGANNTDPAPASDVNAAAEPHTPSPHLDRCLACDGSGHDCDGGGDEPRSAPCNFCRACGGTGCVERDV